MSIRSRLKELGIPSLEGQACLYYQIGTAAITLAILALLSWLSVGFGQHFVFSFSWLLAIALVVLYICSRVNILLLIATAFVLAILTLVGLLIGSPFTSIFGLIIFLVLLIGGWYLQHHAIQMQHSDEEPFKQEYKALLFAPLSFTAFILIKLKFVNADED